MRTIRLPTLRGGWLSPIVALAGCASATVGAQALFAAHPLATVAVLLGTPATFVLGAFSVAMAGHRKRVVRVLATGALALVVFGIRALVDVRDVAAPLLMMTIAGPIGLGALALWWWGVEYVEIDVPAGTARVLTIKKRVSLPLDQLGPLSVVEKARQGLRNRRIVSYDLVAAGVPDVVVFSSHDRAAVVQRRARIELLIAASAVRRILATEVREPGAFRAAPDLEVRVRHAVTDTALLAQVLAELARDHDAHVRAGAAEVASSMGAPPAPPASPGSRVAPDATVRAMITSGLAYSIGYEPYRLALAHGVAELLERLTRDPRIMANPKLKHAIEFASRGAKIEQTVAAEKANALIARAAAKNIALPELPTSVKQWAAWVASLADHIAPMLPGRDAAVAFEAGTMAAALMVQWGLAEKLAYLRAADPEQPDLAAEAASTTQKIAALRERLEATLASVQRPLVARKLDWIEERLHRAPRPDATSSATWSSNYAHIADWQKLVDTLLSSLDADFDAPLATHPTSEPTADEQRLFAEILERPDDDELRRRYAELAAKRLDPRAELIREQLAIRDLEARGELVLGRHPQRVEELIVSHPEWTAPLTELGARDVQFDRGFPSEITIDVGDFLAHAPRLFERAPITSVHLRGGLGGRGAALARLPQLAKLTALDLSEQGVTDADLSALASSPYVSRLRSLNLAENRLTEAGIESLAASTRLTALERVALDLNPGGNPADQLRYYDETHQEPVPTEAGLALEQKYGTLRWLHPYRRE